MECDNIICVVSNHTCRRVGMADEADSKSVDGNIVRVQVPLPAVQRNSLGNREFFYYIFRRILMKSFKERYLAGEIEFEVIDDLSYEWGMSEDERTLAQYLGLNAEEEDAWVSIGEDALRELLDKQKK